MTSRSLKKKGLPIDKDLKWKLLNQGFPLVELKSSLRTFYDRHPTMTWLTFNEYLCHK